MHDEKQQKQEQIDNDEFDENSQDNQIDPEEVEEDSDALNQYEKDSFLVSSEESEEEFDDQPVQNKAPRRKKKKKRNREDDFDKEADQDDLELMKENRKRRLKKMNSKPKDQLDEEEDFGFVKKDISDQEDDKFIDDDENEEKRQIRKQSRLQQNEGQFSFGDQKINQIYQTFFPEKDEDLDEPQEEFEKQENQNKQNPIETVFEPSEIEARFAKQEDEQIKQRDQPERLQLRFKNRNEYPEAQELIEETKWIYEKFKSNRRIDVTNVQQIQQIYQKKILKVLDYLRVSNFEIMYIYYYKKNEYLPELTLDDLWKIYDLDRDWAVFQSMKDHIEKQAKILETYMPIPQPIQDLIETSSDIITLHNLRDYIEYQLMKYDERPQDEVTTQKFKKATRRNIVKDLMKYQINQFAKESALTADQLSENINERGIRKHEIQTHYITPEEMAIEYIRPEIPFLNDKLPTLTSVCKFMATEIFYHPNIRKWVKDQYYERLLIFTEPTEKGKKEIDILNYYYPVKRIYRRQIQDFQDETWMMVQQAQSNGLITVDFRFPWDETNSKISSMELKKEKQFRDEIFKQLLDNYIAPIDRNSNEEQKELLNKWNILRQEALSKYLDEFMYPHLQKTLKNELQEISEKYIINCCQKEFKDLLLKGPCMVTTDDKTQIPNCVLSVVMEQDKKMGIVFLDAYGEIQDYDTLKYYSSGPDESNFDIQKEYEKEKENFEIQLKKFKPDLIVVAANCKAAMRIKRELLDYRDEKFTKWVTYGDYTIPQMFAKSAKADQLVKDHDNLIRIAISLGRMKQNTMAEILNLWAEKNIYNGTLYLPLHPLQSTVNQEKLKEQFEHVASEIVNKVGVDINLVLDHKHLESQLQFICGLGPRKAMALLENIRSQADDHAEIRKRREIYEMRFLDKQVFINCAGFIRITTQNDQNKDKKEAVGLEPLDATRIHNENYILAKKISSDALEDEIGDRNGDDDDEKDHMIDKIMQRPQKLQDLDYEDYAKHLAQVKKKDNMIYLLNFIVEELTNPFKDPRQPYNEMTNQELFYKLTKESVQSFRKYMIVSARIEKVDNNQLKVKIMDNLNLTGLVKKNDIDGFANEKDLNKDFQVGQIIKAWIQKIDALEKNESKSGKDDQDESAKDILKVELCMKRLDKNQKEAAIQYLFPKYNIYEKTFKKNEDEDFPKFAVSVGKTFKFQPRKINHPKFKHMSLKAALEFIKDKVTGDFVIRPSSQGPEFLTITWKFYNQVIVHLNVREEQRRENVAPRYILNNESYDSIDEIIERYLNPCNSTMEGVVQHKKFLNECLESMEYRLKRDKENDKGIIHYYFGCFETCPQYIVLMYVPKADQIVKEYIKCKNYGLFFHDNYFGSLRELIGWFKQNYKEDSYRKYVKKSKPPFAEHDKSNNNSSDIFRRDNEKKNNFDIKQEKNYIIKSEKIKHEDQFSSVKCATCGKSGHQANNCTYANREDSRPRRDRAQSSGYEQKENRFSQKRAPASCFSCGSTDHQIKDCPNKQKERQYGGYQQNRSRSRSAERRRSYSNKRDGGWNANNQGGDWKSDKNENNSWNKNNNNTWGGEKKKDDEVTDY